MCPFIAYCLTELETVFGGLKFSRYRFLFIPSIAPKMKVFCRILYIILGERYKSIFNWDICHRFPLIIQIYHSGHAFGSKE